METRFSLKEITLIGVFAALTCILAQISIPIPFSPVPITLQVFAVCISAVILGKKLGTMSQVIYILLGVVGTPVFAGFSGGLDKILGPTGGFILSFPVMAFIIGSFVERKQSFLNTFIALIISLFVCYLIGTLQLSFIMKLSIEKALSLAVIPFIPLDLLKIIAAALLGLKIRSKLLKENLLSC
ncbi:bioY protein [Fervidicella metallireducens AeB]|uniref:Biotin transporter n=1 Tax=Fervidicella metallireducens AeB TaxID=1403537 RepID=A0A017RY78_9CLOT|nr:biotin transporter BioY [Fervidicella metallireducens]EYE89369.1 bioY protein [Fervidicella metallireducens AeB]